jgi:hypothetical protein
MSSSARRRKAIVFFLRVPTRGEEEVGTAVAIAVDGLGFKKHGTW